MLRSALLVLAAATATIPWSSGAFARPITTPISSEVLHITQHVGIDQKAAVSAEIGPLTSSSKGFGIQKNVTSISLPFSVMPRVPLPEPVSRSTAQSIANSWANGNMGQFGQRISQFSKAKGVASTVFTFSQDLTIEIRGPRIAWDYDYDNETLRPVYSYTYKKQSLSFVATIDPSGRAIFGSPKIIDPDPTVLEAIYTPFRAAEGLPATWTYPDRGTLKYRLLDKNRNPLTEWTTEQTNGAYDGGTDSDESDPDVLAQDKGLRCLMDHRYGGCSGPTDISRLMDAYGASAAIVDYVRKLEPDYIEDGPEAFARGAFSYDERTFDCKTLVNKGYFGYVLTMTAERYLAQPDDPTVKYQQTDRFGGKTLSPAEPFTKSVAVSALGGLDPASVLINPHPGDSSIMSYADPLVQANLVYVSPLRARGGSGAAITTSSSGSGNYTGVKQADGSYEYLMGDTRTNYWTEGQYDSYWTFNLDDINLDKFMLTRLSIDDYAQIAVNGVNVYFHPTPLGLNVNMLKYETGTPQNEETRAACRSQSGEFPWLCADSVPKGDPSVDGTCETAGGLGSKVLCYRYKYKSCQMVPADSTWKCTNTVSVCPAGSVQYNSNTSGPLSSYCESRDPGGMDLHLGIDIRHLLKPSNNTIFTRAVVRRTGHLALRMESAGCGVLSGIEQGPTPPVPAYGGASGVLEHLKKSGRI